MEFMECFILFVIYVINPSTTKGGGHFDPGLRKNIFFYPKTYCIALIFSVAGDNCILKIIKQKWISWHKRFEWKKIPKCEVLENSNFSKITKNVKKGSKFEFCHSYFKSSSQALKCTHCPIFSYLWHFLRILCRFLCFWFFKFSQLFWALVELL